MRKSAEAPCTTDARTRRFPLGARVTVEALAGDPYPLFHELRSAEPVTWVPTLGMWMLTRRDDIVGVLADWERFTTDSPASTIRDIFGSHMLTTDGEPQIRYKRRFIGPFRRGNLERNLLVILFGGIETTESAIATAIWTALSQSAASRLASPDSTRLEDVFDPGRPNARDHLTFGAGRHFCLGAAWGPRWRASRRERPWRALSRCPDCD